MKRLLMTFLVFASFTLVVQAQAQLEKSNDKVTISKAELLTKIQSAFKKAGVIGERSKRLNIEKAAESDGSQPIIVQKSRATSTSKTNSHSLKVNALKQQVLMAHETGVSKFSSTSELNEALDFIINSGKLTLSEMEIFESMR